MEDAVWNDPDFKNLPMFLECLCFDWYRSWSHDHLLCGNKPHAYLSSHFLRSLIFKRNDTLCPCWSCHVLWLFLILFCRLNPLSQSAVWTGKFNAKAASLSMFGKVSLWNLCMIFQRVPILSHGYFSWIFGFPRHLKHTFFLSNFRATSITSIIFCFFRIMVFWLYPRNFSWSRS